MTSENRIKQIYYIDELPIGSLVMNNVVYNNSSIKPMIPVWNNWNVDFYQGKINFSDVLFLYLFFLGSSEYKWAENLKTHPFYDIKYWIDRSRLFKIDDSLEDENKIIRHITVKDRGGSR